MYTYWKVASSEGASWTWGWDNSTNVKSWAAFAFSGAHASAPVNANNMASTENSTASAVWANTITPTVADCMLLMIVETRGGDTNPTGTSAYAIATDNPTWTERLDQNDGQIAQLAAATGPRTQTTATGNSSATVTGLNNPDSICALIAIEPASTSSSISETESITIAESRTVTLVHNINKSDSITIAESVSRTRVNNVSKSDSITIAESLTRRLDSNISETESITIAESVSRSLSISVSETESITIAESTTMTFVIVSLLSVSDSITIAESSTVQESQLGGISVSDSKTITESITVQNASLGDISITDSVSIAESLQFDVVNFLSVSDGVTLVDVATLSLNLGSISVSDSLIITSVVVSMTVSDVPVGLTVLRGKDQTRPFTMTAQEWPLTERKGDYPLGFKDSTVI